MKKVALLLSAFGLLLSLSARAANQPRGSLLELHSCQLYAGGCVVSSEATQGGRYMLRVWNFTDGAFNGVDLAGVQFAVLQTSAENLADLDTSPGQAVLYLPQKATADQREALTSWLKSLHPDLGKASFQTRIVPIQLAQLSDGYKFSAGNFVSVRTAPVESCPTGACGEALWYTPRSPNTLFTVVVNRSSKVSEPLLNLKWEDAGKKSIFLARFGDNSPTANLYVNSADLCGPAGKIF
jgi:hypothetical protein